MPGVEGVIGIATLTLVGAGSCGGLCCLAYLLYFRWRIQREQLVALKEFDSVWLLRLTLILCGLVWGLLELLRLPVLRSKGWALQGLGLGSQAWLCRLYILTSVGLLEPCFFLAALFLLQACLCSIMSCRWRNGRLVGLILLCCMPLFLLHLLLLVKEEGVVLLTLLHGAKLPHYFTRAFEQVGSTDAVCTYPLLSTLLLAAFACIYNTCFLLVAWRMSEVVINRQLRLRLYCLVLPLLLLLPSHALLLGLSVLVEPTSGAFHGLSFAAFLTLLLCTGVAQGMLVLRPISDVLALRGLLDRAHKSWWWEHHHPHPHITLPSPPPALTTSHASLQQRWARHDSQTRRFLPKELLTIDHHHFLPLHHPPPPDSSPLLPGVPNTTTTTTTFLNLSAGITDWAV